MPQAIHVNGEWIKVLGPTEASVQSGSTKGVWYAVSLDDRDKRGSCTCKGFEMRKDCRHLRAVRQYWAGGAMLDDDELPLVPFELATSRYQAKEKIAQSGLVPVGITVGKPRGNWATYFADERPEYVQEAAPYGLLKIEDDAEFNRRYVEKLNKYGVGYFQRRFSKLSLEKKGRGLALLCFEPEGEPCHRRIFAEWWEKMTGEAVPEL